MSDTIDRDRLARRKAMGAQMMAYVNEHEAEWMEVSSQLEEALQAFQEYVLKASASGVNHSITSCVGFVLEYFVPSE